MVNNATDRVRNEILSNETFANAIFSTNENTFETTTVQDTTPKIITQTIEIQVSTEPVEIQTPIAETHVDSKVEKWESQEVGNLNEVCESIGFDKFWYSENGNDDVSIEIVYYKHDGFKYNLTKPFYKTASSISLHDNNWTLPSYPPNVQKVSRILYSAVSNILLLSIILTIILTVFFLRLFKRNRSLRTPMHTVLLHMTICDFIAACTGNLIGLVVNSMGFFPTQHAELICRIEGFFSFICADTRLMLTIVLMLERFSKLKNFGVLDPRIDLSGFKFERSHAHIGAVFAWCWSLVWAASPLLGWNCYTYEAIGTACAPNWFAQDDNSRSYTLCYIVLVGGLPLLLLSALIGLSINITQEVSFGSNKQTENIFYGRLKG